MSKFLNQCALTLALTVASTASIFAQNKSDLKPSKEFKAAPGYKVSMQYFPNDPNHECAAIVYTPDGSNKENPKQELQLTGKDLNHNGFIEPTELYSIIYKEEFTNNSIETSYQAVSTVHDDGKAAPWEQTFVTLNGRTEARVNSDVPTVPVANLPYVKRMAPALGLGIKL